MCELCDEDAKHYFSSGEPGSLVSTQPRPASLPGDDPPSFVIEHNGVPIQFDRVDPAYLAARISKLEGRLEVLEDRFGFLDEHFDEMLDRVDRLEERVYGD